MVDELQSLLRYVVENEAALTAVVTAIGGLVIATGALAMKLMDAGRLIFELMESIETADNYGEKARAVKAFMGHKEVLMPRGELKQFRKALKKVKDAHGKLEVKDAG
jgi:hypothetical protein